METRTLTPSAKSSESVRTPSNTPVHASSPSGTNAARTGRSVPPSVVNTRGAAVSEAASTTQRRPHQ